MPRVDLTLETDIERTPRVVQMEGMFDVPSSEKTRVEFHFDAPLDEKPWNVGLIVGPSGAGKSSVARHLFGAEMVTGYEWPHTKSIVDGFGDMPIRETTAALASVGFSSPPNWLRPFHVLSNGEQFRATMARALVDPRPLICVDEFTSVIDRTVAQIGSHAIAKSIRSRGKKLVAVTCHYDVEEWLQPDWVIEPHLGRFAWRSLQRRPPIDVEIVRCDYSSWRWFAPYHYMSAELHKSVRCFVGLIKGEPAAFGSYIYMPHPTAKNIWSFNRVVVRPEFQGIGLGTGGFIDPIASIGKALGFRVRVHPAHPGQIQALARSPHWKMATPPKFANAVGKSSTMMGASHAFDRRVAHFEYVGPLLVAPSTARRLWDG